MLTLPSNMFYTVTLPATLWFFDKNKTDNKILFIDARNIFTQINRAHREFSEAQVQNIAIISKLHKGQRAEFIRLIDDYFAKGMECLVENQQQVAPVSEQLLDVLNDAQGKKAVGDLVSQWQGLSKLKKSYHAYLAKADAKLSDDKAINAANKQQQKLRETFDPFFAQLHAGLKQLDKVVRQHEKAQAEAAGKAGKRTATDRNTK